MESVGEYEYNRKNLIGHGAFALVYKGKHKKTKLPVAIKCINKKNLGRSNTLLGKEINILKELHHENIVQLYECESSSQSYYLVMEYCNGGDLADYLQAKGTLSEDTIRMFLRQIANAMKAMNDQGILHRDLKPQNLLLSHKHSNPRPKDIVIKIADFGFARHLQNNMMAATLCGSPMYMAPEVITSKQYNAKADLWSIGTIVFQCLVGKAPFQANTPQELRNFYEKTRKVEPSIPHGTSELLKDLLLKLLKKNVVERISFNEFFNHRFLIAIKAKSSSPVPVPTRLKSFTPSPISSNNSDPRIVIGESPQRITECSPSEGDPLFLRLSMSSSQGSSKCSEDFVMVSHPFSSNDSLNGTHNTNNSNGRDGKRSSNTITSPEHNVKQKHHRKSLIQTDGSPRHSPKHSHSRVQGSSQEGSTRSPFLMRRTSSGAGSPLTVRYSAATTTTPSRRRAGSGSDSDASTRSRPSPVPIPVPTQVENYERIERKNSLSSNSSLSSLEDRSRSGHLHNRSHSMSPLCIDGSVQSIDQGIHHSGSNQSLSSRQDATTYSTSPNSLRKARRLSGGKFSATPSDFSPILENPTDSTQLPADSAVKTIATPPSSSRPIRNEKIVVSQMNRAQTVPNLAHFEQQCAKVHQPIPRSKTSIALSEQVLRMLFGRKTMDASQFSDHAGAAPFGILPAGLEHHNVEATCRKTSKSLTPPNSPKDCNALLKVNKMNTLWTPHYQNVQNENNSILEQAKKFLPAEANMAIGQNLQRKVNFIVGTPPSLTDALTTHNRSPTIENRPMTDHADFRIGSNSPPKVKNLPRSSTVDHAKELENQVLRSELDNSTLQLHGLRSARVHGFTDSGVDLLSPEDVGQVPEVRELQFYCHLSDCIEEVAEEHLSPLACGFHPDLTCSMTCRQRDTFEGDPLHHVTHKQRQCEQLLLYLRSLQILATALHTIRNKVKAGTLRATNSIKEVVRELNARYKKFCKLCQEAKQRCNLVEVKRLSFVSADKILYFHAVQDCRTAALNEMFEGSSEECMRKYKRALLLLEGMSLCTNSDLDKKRLTKYKRGIDHRLQHLEQVWSSDQHRISSSTI